MKVGSKGFYGILAMADLAQSHKSGQPVQVKDIAYRQKIPEEYLGQIMVLLKRANLVHGTRGPGGGYHLARPPERISVMEILRVLEGSLIEENSRAQKSRLESSLIARRLLDAYNKAVEVSEKMLDEVTVAELCRPEESSPMYYI
ncbi:MAG: RrF2 family transcriptional regulator [Candidatus Binatia bacterium]